MTEPTLPNILRAHADNLDRGIGSTIMPEDIRLAADEIERLHALTEWRPIETAPRDGTPMLLFLATPSRQDVAGGSLWLSVVIGDLQGPENHVISPFGDHVGITHWMPLPAPPEEEGQ